MRRRRGRGDAWRAAAASSSAGWPTRPVNSNPDPSFVSAVRR